MQIKNIIIGLAIMILSSFVAIYGIQTFYMEAPDWNTYCGNISTSSYNINTPAECETAGGKWNPTYGEMPAKTTPSGYCDLYYQCNKELENAQKTFSKTLFLITVPVGIILILIGAALFALESVGAGIMLGGVITLIYGAANYWPNAGSAFRFIISLIGLAIVIAIAYWLNKRKR
ncbi:hypothetical protein J4463_03020 [Candidatus Pacearchaeota archaeon]|nr:hypothetical protein [Candidatus Pacearchaeota archaeon]